MSYNVSNLQDYVNEQRDLLIKNTLLGAKTVQHANMQTGCHGKTAINILDVTATLQDGTACGFNPSGDDTFSQRWIEPAVIKVNKQWCSKDLLKKWMQHEVRVTAGQEKMPFEEKITSKIVKNVADEVEKLLWQGDTDNGDLIDGLNKTLGADVPSGQKIATGTYSDIKDLTYAVYKAIPEYALDNSVIGMSPANYRELVLALTNANMFHYAPEVDSAREFMLPGTNTKVVAIPGLASTNNVVAFEWENINFGTDLEGDMETFDLWFSKDDQVFKLNIEFIAGINVAYPDRIIFAEL